MPRTGEYQPITLDRIFAHCERAGDCLLWRGLLNSYGYGRFKHAHHEVMVHRAVWELINGRPPGMNLLICHHCDVRNCCEPSHLYEGTPMQNSQDGVRRNRRPKGPNHVGFQAPAWRERGRKLGLAKRSLSEEQVIFARTSSASDTAVGQQLEVKREVIRRLRRGETYKNYGASTGTPGY